MEQIGNGTLFLFPTTISQHDYRDVLPENMMHYLHQTDVFITENIRTTRRFLRAVGFEGDFDRIPYFILNKHTKDTEIPFFLEPLKKGKNIGLFSEAGMPGVADPGATAVCLAHQNNLRVKPLAGPSSIFMALAASGFNGQQFAFNGYLPVDSRKRTQAIRFYEKRMLQEQQTQIFIEAPYRNNQLMKALVNILSPETKLCVASEISAEQEFIKSQKIKAWQHQLPDLNKKNTVFLFYA
jgi:16S rRNA (cytidine1402-2'-O)-methyltransferase